jgi:phasin family protein
MAANIAELRNRTSTMMKGFEDFQKLNQDNLDKTVKLFGEWNKGWQAIAAEMSDYTKRAFEDSTATFEKLLAAKSLEQALEIQTSYVRRAYDDYMQQMTRVATMFADLAKEAYKPMERMMYAGR